MSHQEWRADGHLPRTSALDLLKRELCLCTAEWPIGLFCYKVFPSVFECVYCFLYRRFFAASIKWYYFPLWFFISSWYHCRVSINITRLISCLLLELQQPNSLPATQSIDRRATTTFSTPCSLLKSITLGEHQLSHPGPFGAFRNPCTSIAHPQKSHPPTLHSLIAMLLKCIMGFPFHIL